MVLLGRMKPIVVTIVVMTLRRPYHQLYRVVQQQASQPVTLKPLPRGQILGSSHAPSSQVHPRFNALLAHHNPTKRNDTPLPVPIALELYSGYRNKCVGMRLSFPQQGVGIASGRTVGVANYRSECGLCESHRQEHKWTYKGPGVSVFNGDNYILLSHLPTKITVKIFPLQQVEHSLYHRHEKAYDFMVRINVWNLATRINLYRIHERTSRLSVD